MSDKIPGVIGRNWRTMKALKRRDLYGVISECRSDEARIEYMLSQIQKQFDQVMETLNLSREFSKRIESDSVFFAEVCDEARLEANKP